MNAKRREQFIKGIVLLAVCLMVLAGCGAKKYTAADFVGIWDSEYEFGSETVEFCEDGTFQKVANSFLGQLYVTGKYTVNDKKVTVAFDQTGEVDVYDFKFDKDDTMTWTHSSGEFDYVYIKRK